MAQKLDVRRDHFDELLTWLASDRDEAGRLYEETRQDLVRIFGWNRCLDPEGMADETFDRVAEKAGQLRETFQGNPKLYFYAVANNLIKEQRKTIKLRVPIDEVEPPATLPGPSEAEETSELRAQCLDSCLEKLPDDKRELLLTYYGKEKQAKIDQRAELARQLEISIETLRVRMCRLRADLEKCVEDCLDQLSSRK